MELRALLFTSDGGSTATLCHVLDELGLQAEICPELLVAVGRLSTERYDAIIVDWSQETEAAILLKTAREKKALALNVALVADEGSIGRALQQGANSVIKKPVDAAAARDTLSTARDLILSRRSEQRDKETRAAAALAQLQAQEGSIPEMPVIEDAAPKTGFLAQSMSKSALEAEQNMVKPEYESAPSSFQAARGPSAVQEEEAEPAPPPVPVSQKRWDEVRSVFREKQEEPEPEPINVPSPVAAASQDSTGVFSLMAEGSVPFEESAAEPESASLPRYLVFAVVACLVVAAVLYVWAPGNSYLGKVTSALHSFTAKSKSNPPPVTTPTPAPAPEATVEKPAAGTESPAAEDAPPSDPAPVVSGEIDPSKIHIIETKVIPKPGAEQPPKDPANQSANPPDTTQPPAPDATPAAATPDATPATATTTSAPESQPAVQPPPVAPPPVRPQPPAPAVQTAPGEGRTGVIIPDSLRNSPSASPASSLEPSSVPEQTSLGLLIHRVEPDYPQQALAQHLEGPVVLQAWVARDGTVRDVKLVKGYFVLARAAFDAVKQWRFKPYSPNGKAIDFQTVLTLNFKYPN